MTYFYWDWFCLQTFAVYNWRLYHRYCFQIPQIKQLRHRKLQSVMPESDFTSMIFSASDFHAGESAFKPEQFLEASLSSLELAWASGERLFVRATGLQIQAAGRFAKFQRKYTVKYANLPSSLQFPEKKSDFADQMKKQLAPGGLTIWQCSFEVVYTIFTSQKLNFLSKCTKFWKPIHFQMCDILPSSLQIEACVKHQTIGLMIKWKRRYWVATS